jgi:cyclopropane fatty-acyl-phospholipid synthase-like methyltransferase
MSGGSLPASYFEDLYAADPDPWRFATSDYEREKYAATLAALGTRPIGAALEIGCSIGVLTRQLAPRCARLVAVDVAEAALDEARRRCADQTHVAFARMQVPGAWPLGTYDVIVLSEVLYYLDHADIGFAARRVKASLAAGGTVLLVHWTGPTNYPCTGDEAAELFMRESEAWLARGLARREAAYRLDRLDRV